MLLWCAGLLACRSRLASGAYSGGGDKSSFGLLWNLGLAVVPLLWSGAFQAAEARGRPGLAGVFLLLWLLFLPNAPYLLTDLLHLRPSASVPLWFLLAVLLSCAGAGTMLGYLSLAQVQAVIERRRGRTAGWAVAVGALMLCGFGIYLGRFLHWNSWDAFVHPARLLGTIGGQFVHPGARPHPLAVTAVFGVGLIVGYLALRAFAASAHSTGLGCRQ